MTLQLSLKQGKYYMSTTIDFIFLFILTLYFLTGWHKGLLSSLLDSITVIIAYITTIYFSKTLAVTIANPLDISKIEGWIIAILILFFSTYIGLSILKSILIKLSRNNNEDHQISITSHILGSITATITGIIVLSLVITGYEASSGLSQTTTINLSHTRTAKYASQFYKTLIPDSTNSKTKISKLFLTKPRTTAKRIKGILENHSFKQIITSSTIINQAIAADRFALANNKLLLKILGDQELQLKLESLKLIQPGLPAKDYRILVIDQLIQLGEKLKKSGKDKLLRREINELAKSGDLRSKDLGIIYKNKNFQNIIDILLF
jgi:uncharacterized membrane protein required for colicin V production